MKQFLLAAIMAVLFFSCKKESAIVEHKKTTYSVRIEAKGDDGTVYYSNEAYYANGNGGQSNENLLSKIEYMGYQNGHYVISLTNKQGCGIDFQMVWLEHDTTIHVESFTTKTIQLPGATIGGKKIKAKALYTCGNSGGDLGWIELETPISLPVKFKSMRIETSEKGKLKIVFDVAEMSKISVFNIQLRTGDGQYKNVGVVFPDETHPNRQYSITISI